MKTVFTALLLCLTQALLAQTIQDAIDTYSKRGQDAQFAMQAANIYAQLAANSTDKMESAKMLTMQSSALYFYGLRQSTDSAKESIHESAFNIADKAITLISKEADRFGSTAINSSAEAKSALAKAHYQSAINMGKWAEARGILASLSQWSNMKKHLDATFKNDETVYEYGPYRTQGRAWLKLPFTHGGSKKKSLKDLRVAYQKTFNDIYLTSTNSTTTLFYLDTLVDNKVRGDEFCDAYFGMADLEFLSDEELKEINPNTVPEIKFDIKNFKNEIDFEEDIHAWADRNC